MCGVTMIRHGGRDACVAGLCTKHVRWSIGGVGQDRLYHLCAEHRSLVFP